MVLAAIALVVWILGRPPVPTTQVAQTRPPPSSPLDWTLSRTSMRRKLQLEKCGPVDFYSNSHH
jgi:hypothetical protein